ncbi:MAG: GDP-L-fucose synthase [Actinomycetales bacterium]|nr:GDP-L-fucose synthase [Actinomycetales bacterium]
MRVWVAGSSGLAGSAIARAYRAAGAEVIGVRSVELDLRDRAATFTWVADQRPELVIVAAAKVGGIGANSAFPVDFLSDNVLIQTNVMDAAHAADVPRLVFLGSSCIYPQLCPQPIKEEYLLTGPLEASNQPYALAKIAGVQLVHAYRTQYGRRWISAMPTNLYGPFDNFDLQTSHVLPALLHRFHLARAGGDPEVTLWGTGTPRREFLHSDDLAAAVLVLAERYDDDRTINVGTGEDLPIADLATLVARVVGFEGRIVWDDSKPDGTPRKVLDVSRVRALGWQPQIGLAEGIASTYEWFRQHHLDDAIRRANSPAPA